MKLNCGCIQMDLLYGAHKSWLCGKFTQTMMLGTVLFSLFRFIRFGCCCFSCWWAYYLPFSFNTLLLFLAFCVLYVGERVKQRETERESWCFHRKSCRKCGRDVNTLNWFCFWQHTSESDLIIELSSPAADFPQHRFAVYGEYIYQWFIDMHLMIAAVYQIACNLFKNHHV